MKLIQKYQSGYGITPVTYTPLQYTASGVGATAPSSDSSSKGELLSEQMIKLLSQNALTSDMSKFVQDTRIFGDDILGGNFMNAGTKTKALLQYLTQMSNQKERFDKGLEQIKSVEGASEVAISPEGGLYVYRDGGLQMVSIDDLEDDDRPLTNIEIANIRENSPSAAFATGMTATMLNATSFKQIRSVIDDILKGLGDTEHSYDTYFNPARLDENTKEAFMGLELSKEEMSGLTLDQIYKVTKKTKTNVDRAERIVKDVFANLTPNMRTLLALRAKQLNTDEGVLIYEYISKNLKHERSISLDIQTSLDPKTGKKKSSTGDSDDFDKMKMSNSQLLITGRGESVYFDVLNEGQYGLQLAGIRLPLTKGGGNTMGQTTYAELMASDYGGILDFRNATMGDQLLNRNLSDRIAIVDDKIVGVDLPIDQNSEILKPDIDSLKRMQVANDEIKEMGINMAGELTEEQQETVNKVYAEHQLPYMYVNGRIDTTHYHRFAIVKGQTTDAAFTDKDDLSNQVMHGTLRDVEDNEERNAFSRLITRNSGNDKSKKYQIDNGWIWNDDLYEGNIYIPIVGNIVSAGASSKNMMTSENANIAMARSQFDNAQEMKKQVYQPGKTNDITNGR